MDVDWANHLVAHCVFAQWLLHLLTDRRDHFLPTALVHVLQRRDGRNGTRQPHRQEPLGVGIADQERDRDDLDVAETGAREKRAQLVGIAEGIDLADGGDAEPFLSTS